jgi:segregation and condensation protein B
MNIEYIHNPMNLKSSLESLLFVAIKPLSLKELAALTSSKPKEAEAALLELREEYHAGQRGLCLVENGGQYQLASAPENAALVQEFLKDETSGELSQPSLEALTIIAYRGPVSKGELERIRGVNCSLILRNLLLRGLVEEKREKGKEDAYYSVTHDFVRFLGLDSLEDLPEYSRLHQVEALTPALVEDDLSV